MDDQRKWEDLDMDCLVNVLGRLEMETLLLDAPFVCKSWYRATRNPLCWKRITFPDDAFRLSKEFMNRYGIDRNPKSLYLFIKLVVDLSQGQATALSLPAFCSKEALEYVSNVCPFLKVLELSEDSMVSLSRKIEELICKWKHLESLTCIGYSGIGKLFSEISIHCKEFRSLVVYDADILEDEPINAIVSFLPRLQELSVRKAKISRDSIISLLRCCKELKHLDVRYCVGVDEDDVEILELAANINSFSCEVVDDYSSDFYDYWDDDDIETYGVYGYSEADDM